MVLTLQQVLLVSGHVYEPSDGDVVANLTAALAPIMNGAGSVVRYAFETPACEACTIFSVCSVAFERRLGLMQAQTLHTVASALIEVQVVSAPIQVAAKDANPRLLLDPVIALVLVPSTSVFFSAGSAMVVSRNAGTDVVFMQPAMLLVLEAIDLLADWTSFILALGAGDLEFTDDGGIVKNTLLCLNILNSAFFALEVGLAATCAEALMTHRLLFVFVGMCLEDVMQAEWYAVVGATQAAGGLSHVLVSILALIQSLVFMMVKLLDLSGALSSGSSRSYRSIAPPAAVVGRTATPQP